jgi:hypothetical protein
MNAAGRWRRGYLAAVGGGFVFCTLHWSLVSLFQNPCGLSRSGPLSAYRDPYFYGGLMVAAASLLAAYQFWFEVVVVQITAYGFCF